MTRPTALPVDASEIPSSMKCERRWFCWRYEWEWDGKRWTKRPYQPSGAYARSDDPRTWTTFEAALAAYRVGGFDGVGFMLGDGWGGLDLDHCLDGKAVVPNATGIVKQIDDVSAYREVSPSRTGYKAIGRSARIGGQIDFSTDPPSFTRWTSPRYFAITGAVDFGTPNADITALIDAWFPTPVEVASSAREGYALAAESTDDDLLNAAVANERNGDEFLALWRGDLTAYGNDHSRADMALLRHLAFWTNYDAARVDRLFRQSNLMRDKWEQPSYRRATLGKALR
jgi:putative DNA primase/helicase